MTHSDALSYLVPYTRVRACVWGFIEKCVTMRHCVTMFHLSQNKDFLFQISATLLRG